MSPDELLDCRWQLLYRSEYSTRYHRRRAAFLTNLDTLLTLVTITAGASAFGDLVAGTPGWVAKLGAAVVTIISIAQVILKLGPAGIMHTAWLKRWNSLHTDLSLNTDPNAADIKRWTIEKATIEEECVGELRALCIDCEDATARVLHLQDRQHYIHPMQRLLIHFGSFQQRYPYLHERQQRKGLSNDHANAQHSTT